MMGSSLPVGQLVVQFQNPTWKPASSDLSWNQLPGLRFLGGQTPRHTYQGRNLTKVYPWDQHFWGIKQAELSKWQSLAEIKSMQTSSNSTGSSGLCCPARRQGYRASICPALTSHQMKAAPGKEKWYINDYHDKQLKHPLPHTLIMCVCSYITYHLSSEYLPIIQCAIVNHSHSDLLIL